MLGKFIHPELWESTGGDEVLFWCALPYSHRHTLYDDYQRMHANFPHLIGKWKNARDFTQTLLPFERLVRALRGNPRQLIESQFEVSRYFTPESPTNIAFRSYEPLGDQLLRKIWSIRYMPGWTIFMNVFGSAPERQQLLSAAILYPVCVCVCIFLGVVEVGLVCWSCVCLNAAPIVVSYQIIFFIWVLNV